MKNDIDELLNRAFGRRPAPEAKPQLTLEPQPTAPARRRAAQKTPPSPQKAAPKKPGAGQKRAPQAAHSSAPGSAFGQSAQAVDALQKSVRDMSEFLDKTAAAQRAELEAMNQSALEDIARIRREVNTPAVQNLARGAGESAPTPGVARPSMAWRKSWAAPCWASRNTAKLCAWR